MPKRSGCRRGIGGNGGGRSLRGCSTSNPPALTRRAGDHAMTSHTTKPDSAQPAAETVLNLFDNWFDPIEAGVRNRVREFIETMMEDELEAALSRPRYARVAPPSSEEAGKPKSVTGHRHGHPSRSLL